MQTHNDTTKKKITQKKFTITKRDTSAWNHKLNKIYKQITNNTQQQLLQQQPKQKQQLQHQSSSKKCTKSNTQKNKQLHQQQ